MSNMPAIEPTTATDDAKAAFDEAQAQFGGVINLFKVIGSAPNVLQGILALNKNISHGSELSGALTEQIAMLVSALNRCDYCVNVHMVVGKSQGLSEQQLLDAMQVKADDTRAQALLDYTNEIVRNRGLVSDTVMARVRAEGFSDKALLETIGVIGLYTTLQYIRHVADPAHDFPTVSAFNPDKHGANDGTVYSVAEA